VGADAPTLSPPTMRLRSASNGRGAAAETSVETAIDWAEIAAMLGDFREAVSWLVYVEWLQGTLSPELAARRERWEQASQPSAA
jgi:hypothetical protein